MTAKNNPELSARSFDASSDIYGISSKLNVSYLISDACLRLNYIIIKRILNQLFNLISKAKYYLRLEIRNSKTK